MKVIIEAGEFRISVVDVCRAPESTPVEDLKMVHFYSAVLRETCHCCIL